MAITAYPNRSRFFTAVAGDIATFDAAYMAKMNLGDIVNQIDVAAGATSIRILALVTPNTRALIPLSNV